MAPPPRADLGHWLNALRDMNHPGVGYSTISAALTSDLPALTLGILILAKIAATSITIGSGGSGGVFAPSLFLGAMTGGFLGTFIHQFAPEATADSGAYALVLVAGVLGIAGAAGRGRRLLPCLVLAAVTSVHVLANAKSRYRLPLMPLLVVYASHALLHAGALAGRLRGGALVAAALVVGTFLVVCVPHFAPQAAALWWRGSYR